MKFGLFATLICCGWHLNAANAPDPQVATALVTLNASNIFDHVRVIASDEFEGRAPGTPGEERTVKYLVDQFKKFGLAPGNPDGTFIQKVPLRGITTDPLVSFNTGENPLEIALPKDCVVWSRLPKTKVEVKESEMVFVGYGIVAPEYDWDDFKGVDVKGKTVVMLINDPPAGFRMIQKPVRELQKLRGKEQTLKKASIAEANSWFMKQKFSTDLLEIEMEVEGVERNLNLKIQTGDNEEVVVGVDREAGTLLVNRSRDGKAKFHNKFPGTHQAPLRMNDPLLLHILLDTSSVEVFANQGESVITDLILPSTVSRQLELSGADGTRLKKLSVWELKSAWR